MMHIIPALSSPPVNFKMTDYFGAKEKGIMMDKDSTGNDLPAGIEISDDDIYEAMKDMQGYIDITPTDLKEVYRFAYRRAWERLNRSVRARDIMTEQVFSVKRTTPLAEVAGLMADKAIAGLPVLEEDGRVAGVISEKDFLSLMGARDRKHFMAVIAECLKGTACVSADIRAEKAEDIMTSPAVTVREDATLADIADIFTGKNINRVPVVDRGGNMLGIVSRADFIRASVLKRNS
jgi:CBS domain-containing protein